MNRALRMGPDGVDRAALVLLALAFVLTFGVTRTVTQRHRDHERELAQSFVERGTVHLRSGEPAKAVEASRNALFYARNAPETQFRLAQALLAARRTREARPYLQALWRADPSVGFVNLELARMEAGEGDAAAAVRHYQGAVHGVWEAGGEDLRRRAHRELIAVLERAGDKRRAVAELVALTSSVEEKDARAHADAGAAFLRLGEPRLALDAFRQALAGDDVDDLALAGAAEAASHLAEWRLARDYVRRIPAGRRPPEAQRLLETAGHVIALDPWAPRISISERSRRARLAVTAALERLESCAAGAEAARPHVEATARDLAASLPWLQSARVKRDPDAVEAAFVAAVAAEDVAAQHCGAPRPVDDAIAILARRAAGEGDGGGTR